MKNCSGNCGSCGSCGNCGGCGKSLLLSEGEVSLLQTLGQFSFLPVARRADDMTPVYLEDEIIPPDQCSLILQILEQKDLIDIDYTSPLKGFDMTAYAGYPVYGSVGLTARGQAVLDLLDKQGFQEA